MPGIYSPWTNQQTFSTQHTFLEVVTDLFGFSSLHQHLQFTDIEFGQVAGGTSGRTSSASDTELGAGYVGRHGCYQTFIIFIIIDDPRFRY